MNLTRASEEVRMGRWAVSDTQLYSMRYASCRALILSDGNKAGLAHIVVGQDFDVEQDPDEYLDGMCIQLNPQSKLNAAIIEAQLPYSKDLRICCAQRGISVVSYVLFSRSTPRDVVVHPDTRKAIVYPFKGDKLEINLF